ncbi:TPA: glycosyltransferase family 4 protein [Streptococcus suis]|nr:glycosyltransferase family 4 protein [Streptococcus suis]
MTTEKLVINMLSSSEKVKGQGVSGAYRELMHLLREKGTEELSIREELFAKADITHYHTIDPLFYLTTFFKKRVGRRVGYVHFLPETLQGSLQIPRLFEPLVAKYVTSFYNRMDSLVVVNPTFIDDLVEHGISREKITFLPNFVNREKWYPVSADEKNKVRAKYGIGPNDFVVMGAGQVQKRKGIDDFAQLATLLPEITFIWAGGFSFGSITEGHAEYRKLMSNPPKNLIFTGIIEAEEMRSLYGAADIFFLPSYSELFPMTILEAASCGTAIMLRDIELYKVILDGYYLPAKDLQEMKEQVEILSRDNDLVHELREKSRQISEQYSPEVMLDRWLVFYKEQYQLQK